MLQELNTIPSCFREVLSGDSGFGTHVGEVRDIQVSETEILVIHLQENKIFCRC